jgi:formylglycine-generating enzyme required for sulfatase activity
MKILRTGLFVLFIVCIGCAQNKNLSNENMVLVEGGEFVMGTDSETIDSLANRYGFPREYIASEYPPHKVTLTTFYIDRHEVTNADFKDFIDQYPLWQKENFPDSLHNGEYLKHWEKNSYPAGESRYPVVNITWYAAMEYCKCMDKRLPTEAEWEYVAGNRGESRIYPWGNSPPDSSKANYFNHIGKAIEVGRYPPNELGVYDLAGNVWEFILDGWSYNYYVKSPQENPLNGLKYYTFNKLCNVKSRRVIRGGSWGGAEINLRIRFRDSHPPQGAGNHVGFRCVKEADDSGEL